MTEGITDPNELTKFLIRDEVDGKFYCSICNLFSHVKRSCVRNHVEAKHFPNTFTYDCPICAMTFNNKTSLNNHKANKHK